MSVIRANPNGNVVIRIIYAAITMIALIPAFISGQISGFSEEYLCRGLLRQTFGSLFKIPIGLKD